MNKIIYIQGGAFRGSSGTLNDSRKVVLPERDKRRTKLLLLGIDIC